MSTRSATTTWNDDLEGGSGTMRLLSSGAGDYPFTYYQRTGADPAGTTGPEELLAAAHSIDYAMRLATVAAQSGGTPQRVDVRADVSLGADPQGGFKLTGIRFEVSALVAGLEPDAVAAVADTALHTYALGKSISEVPLGLTISGQTR